MRSRNPLFWLLLKKEWRELTSSWAWWVFLLLVGPLVGVCFINAVNGYAEASGLNGTAAGVGEAFSPLIGVWGPTLSACELAAAFLLPFVAIKLVSADRQSGALKIELQRQMPLMTRIGAKAVMLVVAWGIALLAPLLAVVLWRGYGGSIYMPELSAALAGHLLNACLTIALAAAAASVAENPSTAAIVTLSITVGSWIINFVAAIHGGLWEKAAGYTPTALVDQFQHGLVRLDSILVALSLIGVGCSLAAIWGRLGKNSSVRAMQSCVIVVAGCALIWASTLAMTSWDVSENRMNSFSRADEAALGGIGGPLKITVHLAPEDPRRVDLERRAISKLRRAVPGVEVEYESATVSGLFEQTRENYGEIWYEMSGRKVVSRATTQEAVLESIYSVAQVAAPPENDDDGFRGHPLAVRPRGAALIFYGLWPLVTACVGIFTMRRNR